MFRFLRAPLIIAGFLLTGTAVHAATITFSNPASLTIGPNAGPASIYPTAITVSGFTGGLTNLELSLSGLSHTWPADLDMLLVGPTGANLIFMSDSGNDVDLGNINLRFSDAAAATLPGALIVSGTYRPTNLVTPGDAFASPAPPGPYNNAAPQGSATFASVFGGTDPNGIWSLYIVDDNNSDGGSLSGGWSLTITAPHQRDDPASVPLPATLALFSLGLSLAGAADVCRRRYRRRQWSRNPST